MNNRDKRSRSFDLLFLFNEKEKNKNRIEKFFSEIEEHLGSENIKKKEERADLKLVPSVSKRLKDWAYFQLVFSSDGEKVKSLEKDVLQAYPRDICNRYLLVNLEGERKLKTNKKKIVNK
jgi:hypothetical protein